MLEIEVKTAVKKSFSIDFPATSALQLYSLLQRTFNTRVLIRHQYYTEWSVIDRVPVFLANGFVEGRQLAYGRERSEELAFGPLPLVGLWNFLRLQ